jgi:hypothetical protein
LVLLVAAARNGARAAKCGLTLRSSGPPPASRLAREPASVIIRSAGQVPSRGGPLSSNVRRHEYNLAMRIILVLAITLLSSSVATAERFLGTMPDERLSEFSSRYPNAKYEELRPAWLQPYQRLVQISGSGVEGVVAFKLEHEVDSLASQLKTLAIKQANRGTLTDNESWALANYPDRLSRLQKSPPPDPWEIKDVRWQPAVSVPLKSAIAKYGTPDKDELDEQFKRLIRWDRRGITAYVAADDTLQLIVFEFTIGDILCGPRWKKSEPCDPLDPAGSGNNKEKPAAETKKVPKPSAVK